MKSAMANKLLATPRPEQHPVGGNVPVVLSDDESVELVDLVDEDSWLAFNILKLEGKWLSDDPANWCNSEQGWIFIYFWGCSYNCNLKNYNPNCQNYNPNILNKCMSK